jgi:very-short-patch-repair endonuclease
MHHMREESARPDALVAELAARQHGVVTTDQLRARGVSRSAVARRLDAGRLHRIHRGVYAVGHRRLTFEGRCLAAVLACGEGAVVSHRGAGALWGLLLPSPRPIEVTVPGYGGRRKQPGIVIHRSTTLSTEQVTRRRGIPLTQPARTLQDLRRVLTGEQLRKATRRALDLRLDVGAALDPEPDLTRRKLERRFLRLCRSRSLPSPEVNARVGPYEVDFLWRDLSLIVETDGFRHHGNRAAFEADRARDSRLQALGYRVLRFTYRQVSEDPRAVVATLRDVMRASGGPGPRRPAGRWAG